MTRQKRARAKALTPQQVRAFRHRVWRFYREHGRHTLPWRKTTHPYRVLVSEVMLQQTQVDRVIPKYRAFIRAFPTVAALARAPLADVLRLWSGLGYNRRARMLHRAAQVVCRDYAGRIPKDYEGLLQLPGVGSYTAAAVCVFAYNAPMTMIETNIRSVFLHEFFAKASAIADHDIAPLIAQTLPQRRAREWYAALMDYGTYIKKHTPNPSRRSAHHTRQRPFRGSRREVRGAVVRALLQASQTARQLVRDTGFPAERVTDALAGLEKDGLVYRSGTRWALVAD